MIKHNLNAFVYNYMTCFIPPPSLSSQMRGFSRSPSPPPIYQAPLPLTMSRGSLPATSRPSMPPRAREGITTMTSMIIQNLSDTVSKNDVAVSVGVWVCGCACACAKASGIIIYW